MSSDKFPEKRTVCRRTTFVAARDQCRPVDRKTHPESHGYPQGLTKSFVTSPSHGLAHTAHRHLQPGPLPTRGSAHRARSAQHLQPPCHSPGPPCLSSSPWLPARQGRPSAWRRLGGVGASRRWPGHLAPTSSQPPTKITPSGSLPTRLAALSPTLPTSGIPWGLAPPQAPGNRRCGNLPPTFGRSAPLPRCPVPPPPPQVPPKPPSLASPPLRLGGIVVGGHQLLGGAKTAIHPRPPLAVLHRTAGIVQGRIYQSRPKDETKVESFYLSGRTT